ncbi:DUF262 domain-containing protein [Gemmatimonadota bacterium]
MKQRYTLLILSMEMARLTRRVQIITAASGIKLKTVNDINQQGTIMQAQDMPFTKLINVDQGARDHFHVPKYQREYAWRKWQLDQLLNDIEENDPGYFVGSIICVSDAQTMTAGDEIIYDVVDGQQRLTTISLLLAAIYSKLTSALPCYEPADERDKEEAVLCVHNIRAKLIKRKKDARRDEYGSFSVGKDVYFLRVQPSVQNHNLADYRYLLSEAGLIKSQARQAYCGNRLLGRAYYYFQEKIPEDVPGLLKLLEKINQLMFVQITVGTQSDAFTLFESLNNRGVPLSAMDIIKNKMLAKMERKHKADIDESFERWQGIIEAIPEVYDQERFLRHFYNAFKHSKQVKVDKVTRATRSQIIHIYETLINRNAPLLFDELTKSSAIYGRLLRSENVPKQTADGLTELDRIGSAPAYLLLLYLFSLGTEHIEEENFLARVVNLMGSYFIRRNLTDKPPTRQIDQGLIDVVESCATRISEGKQLSFDWFFDELMKHTRPASLDELKAALEGDIYYNNSAMARYVLIQIDQLHHSREYQPDLWARNEKGRLVWTVEHVLPQAERLPEHWVKMIAGGDSQKAGDLQDKFVHRLGNLTLSGYNSDLAVSPFEKKQKLSKDRSFLGHKINIGYKNGLFLNTLAFKTKSGKYSLADAPSWDAEMIEARTKLLVDMIVKANLLPGE